ncbi:hypothetical protein [Duganella vulcania]|uniref:Uncharacterized protein n=1 Tax=Duganella vulcania TaxID=2692166 RepID=A0A845GFS5_9BURK|nr:hypothetical protein [Duganella vulcania]MYM92801.1 hypothetical protein [Duganella vulcania]
MKYWKNLLGIVVATIPVVVMASNLWVDKDPIKTNPKEDKRRRMAFLERCHTQYAGKQADVPAWCPCAYDFVVRHDYYVNYLAYKSKGQEMQVALRDFAPRIVRECGWVEIVEPENNRVPLPVPVRGKDQ